MKKWSVILLPIAIGILCLADYLDDQCVAKSSGIEVCGADAQSFVFSIIVTCVLASLYFYRLRRRIY